MSAGEEGLIFDTEKARVMAHAENPIREAAAAVIAAAEHAGTVAGREYEACQSGRLALHETVATSETAKAVTYVTAADFVLHEEAAGFKPGRATRPWNVLTREHLVDSPLGIRFGEPLEAPVTPHGKTMDHLDQQLDFDSLVAAMEQLKEMSRSRAHESLGRNAGEGVRAFLDSFVTAYRQQLAAASPDSDTLGR